MPSHCHCSTVPASAGVDERIGQRFHLNEHLSAGGLVTMFLHTQEGMKSKEEQEAHCMATNHKPEPEIIEQSERKEGISF